MNGYKEPHYGEPQVFWDVDDAITCLVQASKQIRAGGTLPKVNDAKTCLEYAILSAKSALEKVAADEELEAVMTIGAAA